ncbi:hypothetical protein [Oceanithermus sp.]|uniref:hypothetical protein n=1 Tax=Oceanithermus sp. TaxID=2268145 RepID=UPI00257AF097|nr:hypothetical protein [Oceanithermus sp.]
MSLERVWSFASDAFAPAPDEAELVNPGLGGHGLAEFLARGLAGLGAKVNRPVPEDWGWRLELVFEGRRFWMGCGAVSGEPGRFVVFLKARRGLGGLLAAAVWRESFERLEGAVWDLLRESPEVRELEVEGP